MSGDPVRLSLLMQDVAEGIEGALTAAAVADDYMGARLRLKSTTNISGYPTDVQKIMRAMMKYGLIVADNTLWSGKAARPAAADDKDTKAIQEFNRLVYASKDLYPALIPLRDGVTVCRKM